MAPVNPALLKFSGKINNHGASLMIPAAEE
jgi:hypothetical protein